jgi:hypothetical protein
MRSDGKIRVIVRSRKVPTRTFDFSEPVYSPLGVPMGTRSNRLVIYDYVLDERHRKAVEEGHRLACNLGLELEVVDRSRSGLSRFLSRLGRASSSHPSMIVSLAPKTTVSDSSPTLFRGR